MGRHIPRREEPKPQDADACVYAHHEALEAISFAAALEALCVFAEKLVREETRIGDARLCVLFFWWKCDLDTKTQYA